MRRDTWLPARMRAHSTMTRGEHRLHAGLIAAMTLWLDTARALVLGQPLPDAASALLADAGSPTPDPDLDAARASFGVWERALSQHVFPVLDEAFGEAFAANQRAADISVVHWQELAMATVHDRLKIWPEGAFEELRPELLEAMANSEDIDQVQDRIGRILGIDAPARRIRAEISAVDRKLKDPTTPRAEIPILKGKRRQLWNQHDERNLEWQWLARRIARTEIQAAMEAGALAAAQASEEITGDKMYKRWLSTHDERTRLSHAVADGQMVRLTEPFIVGGTPIQHPADPAGLAHETINCRCTLAILSWGEMQAELQGMWGGRGVGPMNARLGPDDEAAVATAIDRLQRERNGEVIEDEPTATTAVTEGSSEELGRKPFDEKKHRRDHDGRFGPKTGTPDFTGEDNPRSSAPAAPAKKDHVGEPVPSDPQSKTKDADAPKSAPFDEHGDGSADNESPRDLNPSEAERGPKQVPTSPITAKADGPETDFVPGPPILPRGREIEGEVPGGSAPKKRRKSADKLRDLGLVADPDEPDEYFDKDNKNRRKPGRPETMAADWLRSHGIDVLSVDDASGTHGTVPDALAVVADQTVELKTVTAATPSAVAEAITRAKKQSDRVLVFVANAAMTPADAEAGMRNGIRDAGQYMTEITVVIALSQQGPSGAEDIVLSWAHG